MGYGFDWADVFAAVAENDTSVWVDGGFLFAACFFGFEGFGVAEVYAFSAGCAFCIVDYWVPGYFVSWDSFVFCFGQTCFTFKHDIFITTFKYCYE